MSNEYITATWASPHGLAECIRLTSLVWRRNEGACGPHAPNTIALMKVNATRDRVTLLFAPLDSLGPYATALAPPADFGGAFPPSAVWGTVP